MPCPQQKLELLAKSTKTIKNIISISIFIIYSSMVHLTCYGHSKRTLTVRRCDGEW